MSDETTTEVLAKANDRIKKVVQTDEKSLTLEIGDNKVKYKIIHKAASGKDSQFNAMAIAPIVNGNPDYNNVSVVYAGTNVRFADTGKSGFGSAYSAFSGDISEEYALAVKFLEETRGKVSQHSGKITDVSGFSQSGGYMMKMAAEYGQLYGFQTTSFDDWGRSQFVNLSKAEKKWLLENPEMLIRYQNDSWAKYSGRDSIYGTVTRVVIGMSEHNTLAKYFDGDVLNLDKLAKDGIYTSAMSEQQKYLAAINWLKKNKKDFTEEDVTKKLKEFERAEQLSESYFKLSSLISLEAKWRAGGNLTSNEQIYLDDSRALLAVRMLQIEFENSTENVVKTYQNGIDESETLWQETSSKAYEKGSLLTSNEVIDVLSSVGSTRETIETSPCELYQEKISKIQTMTEKFSALMNNIGKQIELFVQNDHELGEKIREMS